MFHEVPGIRRTHPVLDQPDMVAMQFQIMFHGLVQQVAAIPVQALGQRIKSIHRIGFHSETDGFQVIHNTEQYAAILRIARAKKLYDRQPRKRRLKNAGAQLWVSSVVAFELWYGVGKSGNSETNARKVREFFAGPVELLEFDEEDAKRAGELRAVLEKAGKPIGAYDVLIAGQALRHGLALITANAREFGRVKGLDWEDWGR